MEVHHSHSVFKTHLYQLYKSRDCAVMLQVHIVQIKRQKGFPRPLLSNDLEIWFAVSKEKILKEFLSLQTVQNLLSPKAIF